MKNKIVLGMVIGLLADAVKLTFNYIAFQLNFTQVIFWQITSAMILEKEDIFTPAGILIGGIIDIIVTSFLGVIFIYLIYFLGKEYLWIKGIGYALVVWVSLFGIILAQLVNKKIPPEPSGILVTFFAHLIFGVALVLFTKLLVKDMNVFSEDLKKTLSANSSYKLLIPNSIKELSKKSLIRNYKKPKKI